MVRRYNLSADRQCDILVSLTEAVTNAIVHGNCRAENKTVQVNMQRKADMLALRVSDEGRGFDFKNLPDPTLPENVCKCGGRGVYLMRELSDDISFYNNGSTVEMQFRL